MAGSLARRAAPSSLAFLTLVVAALATTAAHASPPPPAITPIRAQTPSDVNCSSVRADLARWTPAAGAPARFIADAFTRGAGDLWIGLGSTDAGFWSAEAHSPDDACDSCAELDIVVTGFDGKRRSFPVITSAEQARLAGGSPDAVKTLALVRLWHLAKTDWPAEQLRQDYAMRIAPRDAAGASDPYPGWMAEATVRGKGPLRFALRVEGHVMCWCEFAWSGWSLAAPRKR